MKIPEHLPKKLTIAFPIWLLYCNKEDNPLYDVEKVMIECKERGINCLRFDGGAGLTHDLEGNKIEPFVVKNAFGDRDKYMRRTMSHCAKVGEKRCDLTERLIEICTAAKKHGIYVIISSWYYLHTFWYVDNKELNDRLFNVPMHEVFTNFAKYLDYILQELEKHNLLDCVAYAELANESDGWCYLLNGKKTGEYAPISESDEKKFKENHEQALAYLKKRYPGLLFAYDSASPNANKNLIPDNCDIFNCHPYYLWGIYTEMQNELGEELLVENPVSEDYIRHTRDGYRNVSPDWYLRVWYYSNLDKNKIPVAEKWLEERFDRDYDKYIEKLESAVQVFEKVRNDHGGEIQIVCGEAVSYVASPLIQWEEKSKKYWEMIEYMVRRYKDIGMWGTVIRTSCAPEDPIWNMCKDEILRMNKIFLGEIE